jgi:uncharacterized membrane-anchored protein YitT (DUF2179 family)
MDLRGARRSRWLEPLVDYVLIVTGSVLVAIGTNMFFVPNKVVSGGVTGIAIIAHYTLHTPVGMGVLVLNLPLLWLGWRYAGGVRFFVRTVVAVVIMSAAIDLSAPYIQPPTSDRLLVICYGGLLDGLGLGLVFRGRGTTGGTDVLARIAQRWLGVPVGQSLLAMNVLIFGAAGFLFSLEAVMVALALAFVSARVVDLVQEGFSSARAAMIITKRPDEVKGAVLKQLGRGVTVLRGTGGYTGQDRPVLYVVVGSTEVGQLKRILSEVDRRAFVAIAPAKEVFGEGFAPNIPE